MKKLDFFIGLIAVVIALLEMFYPSILGYIPVSNFVAWALLVVGVLMLIRGLISSPARRPFYAPRV